MSNSNQTKCKPYFCAVQFKERKPYSPPPKPYARQLTVSYLNQSGNSVPFIRLCGKWLEYAGFSIDNKVKITIEDNLLIVEPVK